MLDNIRSTTSYVNRLKRVILRISALGLDGATAINTFETNTSLVEVIKNQQRSLLLQQQREVAKAKQIEEDKGNWNNFVKRERSVRSKGFHINE